MKPFMGCTIRKWRPTRKQVVHTLAVGTAITEPRDPAVGSNIATTVSKKSEAVQGVLQSDASALAPRLSLPSRVRNEGGSRVTTCPGNRGKTTLP